MKKFSLSVTHCLLVALFVSNASLCQAAPGPARTESPEPVRTPPSPAPAPTDQERLDRFLEKVFTTMDDNYYLPVSRSVYDQFLADHPAKLLKALNGKTKQTDDFVHLGAGLLVNRLKNQQDSFTNFVPPKKTKEFKQIAYAVTEDLGITGLKKDEGFEITKVQRHCEAYEKGVRALDVILKIDGEPVAPLEESAIRKKLTPTLGAKVLLEIRFRVSKKTATVTLTSKSYFKETVSVLPTTVPGVLILKIIHFNQMTSEDFAADLSDFGVEKIKHLILDLRDNDGGPPLAAREILGFFCPENDYLFAIARKKRKPVMLTAPLKPVAVKAPVTVLVNKRTGSASEMFSGILQAKRIATLVGQQTAGATYLKSMYDFDDGSMIFMITSLTFFFDRRVYPPDGLTPDETLDPRDDALEFVLGKLR